MKRTASPLCRVLFRCGNAVLDAIFPRRCPFCQKLLRPDELYECDTCKISIPCNSGEENGKGTGFVRCVSPLRYEGSVRDAMLRYKFSGKWYYSAMFGKHLADTVGKAFSGCYDVVTWVPVSRRRLHSRGYDQAQLLTRCMCRELGIRCVRTLKKRRHTPAQSLTGGAEARKANVSGAYSAVHTERFAGKRVLLIDDIVTTGATLSECAGILRAAGAREVYCATACKGVLK